jgi:hypothetical protein
MSKNKINLGKNLVLGKPLQLNGKVRKNNWNDPGFATQHGKYKKVKTWPLALGRRFKYIFMQLGFNLRMNVDAFKSNSQLIYCNTEIHNLHIN